MKTERTTVEIRKLTASAGKLLRNIYHDKYYYSLFLAENDSPNNYEEVRDMGQLKGAGDNGAC